MTQSKSYLLFRESIQEIFSFAVMVTASVPILKQTLKIYNQGKISRLPDTDYFQPSVMYLITTETINKLKDIGIDGDKLNKLEKILDQAFAESEFKSKVISAIGEELYKEHRSIIKKQSSDYVINLENSTKGYQKKLATYLYFSAFSYFEAYVVDLCKEVSSQFSEVDSVKYLVDFPITHDMVSNRIKLNKKYDGRKELRYIKFSKLLRSAGFKTPQELLFSPMRKLFDEKVNDLKANDIPVFLEKMFFYQMPENEKQLFHTLRDNRNSIGHGDKAFIPNLSDVMEANKFFKSISAEIDEHVVFYFFKLANFKT